MAGEDKTESQQKHICVIGAGISGLRAASVLIQNGFHVTILEARDRIGGRICQSSRLGAAVDLGASWIHGTEGNPFVELARDTGTVTAACGAVSSICDSHGEWVDRDLAQRLYRDVWDILEIASASSKEQYTTLQADARLKDYFHNLVEEKRIGGIVTQEDQHLLELIVEMWGAFMGADFETQSLKNFWLDESLPGDNLFVAPTFKAILDRIAQDAVSQGTLKLNCEVIRIESRPSERNSILVEGRDGSRGIFDQVVVTAPLGWLKRNQHVFHPPIPDRLSCAIGNLGYGNLDKVFISFPKAFWDNDPVEDGTKSPSFPIESLFLSPLYAEHTNPARWRQEIISYSGLLAKYAHPTVMFFVYGQWGRNITGLVRGMRQDSDEYYRILDNSFRPYYSKLPNYKADAPYCVPRAFLSTDWQADEYAGYGSYTDFPVGVEDGAGDLELLRQGMGIERGVWFAGEHTSPTSGLGTVTGAYWSGEQVATRITQLYREELA
ncbi:amine oxidase [Pleurostoma richardsiae]|uniref:Amine oxidase n=1 Tax=Pleurostoma richardsiae TaxID=41990 RepID=A0AA38SF32_9PEZI|nr:amine oxidase [Pleurostoma richardsiae]